MTLQRFLLEQALAIFKLFSVLIACGVGVLALLWFVALMVEDVRDKK